MSAAGQYQNLVAPTLNESHKTHIFSLTKLAKTASEFCGKMASLKESYGNQVISLVETYKKKTIEIRKEVNLLIHLCPASCFNIEMIHSFLQSPLRPEYKSLSFFSVWDQILDEMEQEAKGMVELASVLQNTVAAALFHEASRKKGLFKKMFTYRDYFQNLIHKSEEDLNKTHKDYTDAWLKYRGQDKEAVKDHRQAVYYNSHNAYLLQLTDVNTRADVTYHKVIPEILEDLEVLQSELAGSFAKYLGRFSQVQLDHQTRKSNERFQNMVNIAGTLDPGNDIAVLVQSIEDNSKTYQVQQKEFTPPKLTKENKQTKESHIIDQSKLREGLMLNDFTEPVLKRRCAFTRRKINKLEATGVVDERDMKFRRPSTSLPAGATNSLRKASEAIMAKNEIREKSCLLSCMKAQIDLYSPAILERLGPISEEYADDLEELGDEEDFEGKKLRLLSMRPDRERAHKFVEHNFMKPAQCYYCKGIIVGLLKQGCRCTSCKMSVHKRCRGNVPFCTGSALMKNTSFDRESVEQDSSAGEYEAIEIDSDPPSPPRPTKGPKVQKKPQRPPSGQVYSVYSPPVPPHSSKSIATNQSKKDNPKECVALFDFPGQEAVDLGITAGDRIKIVDTPSADWWEGQVGAKKGYFPTSYVQVIEPGDKILRCLYDFESEEGDEMCIEEGQIIVLATDEGNGWMVGISGDKKGAFPSSYVETVS